MENSSSNSAKLENGLSALIITFNEESNIKSAIENLSFADEIIIVDSHSTDATVSIASSFENVKIIQNKFINYADQRNFAINLASYPWILFIDADERINPALEEEIKNIIQKENSIIAYEFNRTFLFNKQPLHFSGWQTDKIYRLFRKENGYYDGNKIVHEKLIVNGKSGAVKNKLLHYSYTDYSSYKYKMIQYGKMKAIEELNKGTVPNVFHFYIRPAYQFLYQYIIRLGILDGKKGMIICYLNAYSVYERFQELKKLRSNN
ncbi:Glycosyltransferase involved in cell wall bisynthesis [Flavobacterium sp. 9R]|uniref:glycosyltransferase family 2 protein n=1 Tax=Flavobacterium sp. 9R TaxID=2653143 RepID=UPI0012F3FA3E|nr:glycosyltransferase family 2 protein [Flavobacterium sp. 9R]VXC10407.1 Glycosyltransferase involved in cell wall bisynthesis [Flavobacterium sp. 9R]